MEIQRVRALRGPNVWAHFPVLEAWVDLGPLNDSASDQMPGFNDRLMAWLPSLVEHRCSVGTRGGFFERLRRGTYLAHILEHVALELQTLAGSPVGFGRARPTGQDKVYRVAFRYEWEELGRAALEVARELLLAAIDGREFDVPAEVSKLRTLAERIRPRPATLAVVQAARARDIPVRFLSEGLLQLGHGVNQRRVLAGQTDRTAALAESIARDGELTRSLLQAVGVPVANGKPPSGSKWRLLVVDERVVAAAGLESPADVTERVHPEVAARAVEAARVVGLDVAGVDVAAADLGRPLEEQDGAVLAIDPNPDLGLHAQPAGEAIVESLFPEGETGRVPIVAVTGVNGKTTTTRLIAHIIGCNHRCVGMTCTDGIYVGKRRIEAGDCAGPLSAAAVLQNSRVEAAVFETARGGILRAGLAFDRCDVAVVTNIGEGDHLGTGDVETLEQLAQVKRCIVDVVSPGGTAVLKADDPLVADMARACRGSVVFFARTGDDPVLAAHRRAGGRAVFVRDDRVILAEGEQEIPLVSLERVPLTHAGRVGFQVENVLAAAGAAWSLGVPCEVIHAALGSFVADIDTVPARFNLLEINGASIIMDYGHNVSSLAALVEVVEQLPHQYRSAVYTVAGDRRNDDLLRQAELLGHTFDRVVLYEDDHCIRGRRDGEIIELFRQGMAEGRRVKKIEEVRGAVPAVAAALKSVRPGELLLLQIDVVDESVELVRRHLAETAGREVSLNEIAAAAQPEAVR
jgi:cyanophycin synthetase